MIKYFTLLFDDLIRPRQQRRRDREAKGLGGLEIDHELELGGLLDRQIGGASCEVSGGCPPGPSLRRWWLRIDHHRRERGPDGHPQECPHHASQSSGNRRTNNQAG